MSDWKETRRSIRCRKVILKELDTSPAHGLFRWHEPTTKKAQIDWLRAWANYIENPALCAPDGPNPQAMTELLNAARRVELWFERIKRKQYQQIKKCADTGHWDVEIETDELDLLPLKRAIEFAKGTCKNTPNG